jgi:hypothetical protein
MSAKAAESSSRPLRGSGGLWRSGVLICCGRKPEVELYTAQFEDMTSLMKVDGNQESAVQLSLYSRVDRSSRVD